MRPPNTSVLTVLVAIVLGVASSNARALVVSPGVSSLMLGADSDFDLGQMQSKLEATGVLGQVDTLDLRTGLPTLGELLSYDSISVHSNFSLPDPAALGDLLADYVDAGGGVVVMPFATRLDPSLAIAGRWATGGYSPLPNGGTESTGSWTISTIDQPGHPVLQGVGEVRFNSRFTSAGPLAPGAERIVAWQRGTSPPEAPLVAELPGFQARIMLFNAYPSVSYLNDPGFRLLANTLNYAAAPEPTSLAALFGVLLPAAALRVRRTPC